MDFMEMREALSVADGLAIHVHEESFAWHDAYRKESCYNRNYLYEDYSPAYRAGYQHRMQHADLAWEQAEAELGSEWERIKGMSRLPWCDAKDAAHVAWNHAADSIAAKALRRSTH